MAPSAAAFGPLPKYVRRSAHRNSHLRRLWGNSPVPWHVRITPKALEPGFLADHIGLVELRVRLRQVDDPLDQPDDCAETTRENRDDDSNDATTNVIQQKAVDAEATQQDPHDAAEGLL